MNRPIVFLTHADSDLAALSRAIELLPDGFPPVRGFSLQNVRDAREMAGLLEGELARASVVVVRVLGRLSSISGWQALLQVTGERDQSLLVVSGTGEPSPELDAVSTVAPVILRETIAYLQAGGPHNLAQWLRFLADHLLLTGYGFEAPVELPEHGIYHPALTSSEALSSGDVPLVGITFYRAHRLSGNLRFIDALVATLERRGLKALPVYTSSLRALGCDGKSAALAFFSGPDGTRIDALINTTSFAIGEVNTEGPTLPGWSVATLSELDVPVFQAVVSGMELEQWRDSSRGLNPLDTAMNVVIPEFDGRLITVPVSFKERRVAGGLEVVEYAPLADRVERLAGIVAAQVRLRRMSRKERRIAFIFTNSSSKAAQIGNAVGLDAPASLLVMLRAMQEAGYEVPELPASGDALIHALIERGCYDLEQLTAAQCASALARVPARRYARWFADLPEKLRERMVSQWGAPPGAGYVVDGQLILAGMELGNVVVALQPPRGYGMDPDAIYHQPDLPPTHHYYALYRWLREEWGAHAIVHVGKHGTLEWLPGKGVGLSQDCFPDAFLGDLPLFYPFIINDPGEGSQAKRRAHAVIVDHLTPPMTSAETYGALAQLAGLLDEYYQVEMLDPVKVPLLQAQIWSLVKESRLDQDLGLEPGAEAEDFAHLLEDVDGYLCEIGAAQIRDGLHVIGQVPDGARLVEMLFALTRLPNIGVPGLPAEVARYFGLDFAGLVEGKGRRLEGPGEGVASSGAVGSGDVLHAVGAMASAEAVGSVDVRVAADPLRSAAAIGSADTLRSLDALGLGDAVGLVGAKAHADASGSADVGVAAGAVSSVDAVASAHALGSVNTIALAETLGLTDAEASGDTMGSVGARVSVDPLRSASAIASVDALRSFDALALADAVGSAGTTISVDTLRSVDAMASAEAVGSANAMASTAVVGSAGAMASTDTLVLAGGGASADTLGSTDANVWAGALGSASTTASVDTLRSVDAMASAEAVGSANAMTSTAEVGSAGAAASADTLGSADATARADARASAAGSSVDALVRKAGRPLATRGDALEAVEQVCRTLYVGLQKREFSARYVPEVIRECLDDIPVGTGDHVVPGTGGADISVGAAANIAAVLTFACEQLVPGLARAVDEVGNLLRGLDGRYVPAGPSGAPTRGMAHILPTGRNFYSVDPRSLPSQSAWRVGRQLAEEVLQRHLKETGRYPESVSISVWGTSAMRTHGDDAAEILALLGVRPIWQAENRRLTGVEVIPLVELGRPRIDVTTRISGFFRDAFPQLIQLIDQAVNAVISLDEPPDQNFLRKHYLDELAARVAAREDRTQAERSARYRVFGSKPGTYGAGILPLIQERNWKDEADFAEAYVNWGGYAYTAEESGIDARAQFRTRLTNVEVALHNQDNREHDIFDSDDYLQFHGGLIATIRSLTGRKPRHYFGDTQNPDRAVVRDLKQEALRVFRSRVINPKWLESIRRHGYKGGLECTATVDYLFGFDATADLLDDWMYDEVARRYALDPTMRKFFQESNPWALHAIAERLLEAAQRQMWSEPEPDVLESLKETYLQAEAALEARGEITREAPRAGMLREKSS